MAAANDNVSMALFCDFENVALGVRDAQYEKFDIRPVLERLLAKGSIVVKKAYCDWDRYKGFKAAMHEANFELIEIPHVRQSGKNSADIRMVVDALDLCYTKAHVDTFVIISGDSDFSPLVSKLRENAKRVIGVGVKQSCSDLLVTNCDEFIYYDDLVRDRDSSRGGQRREREKRSPEEEAKRSEKQEERKSKAVEIVSTTFVDLIADRGESERIWASVLKEVVKRRNPGFNENYYGFRSFGNLLEEAANRGLLGFGRDDKGAYVFRAPARLVLAESEAEHLQAVSEVAEAAQPAAPGEPEAAAGNGRRRGTRRSRNSKDRQAGEKLAGEALVAVGEVVAIAELPPIEVILPAAASPDSPATLPAEAAPAAETKPRRGGRRPRKESKAGAEAVVPAATLPAEVVPATESKPRRGGRRPRKDSKAGVEAAVPAEVTAPLAIVAAPVEKPVAEHQEAENKPRKRVVRTPRSRKPKAAGDEAGK